jgi:hypothetical protein
MLNLPIEGAILSYIFDWGIDVTEAKFMLVQGQIGRVVLSKSVRPNFSPSGQITKAGSGFETRFILAPEDLLGVQSDRGGLQGLVQLHLTTGQRIVPPDSVMPAQIVVRVIPLAG